MKIEGRLLNFDTEILGDHKFSKDCKISIPDKLPLVYDFDFKNLDSLLGFVTVTRDEKGLSVSGEFQKHKYFTDSELKDLLKGKGIGGYFNRVKTHNEDGLMIIDECSLKACSITNSPVSKEYTFELKEENDD